jgi:hypothetical protein
MKINEVTDPQPMLDEDDEAVNKASAAVRYNSEVGCLYGMVGKGKFNPKYPEKSIPAEILATPKQTYDDIRKYLLPVFDADFFMKWAQRGKSIIPAIVAKQGAEPTKLSWVGGANLAGGVTDIGFESGETAGISVKDDAGITLANLTPRVLGIETPRGLDTFSHSAKEQYDIMKQRIFKEVLTLAKANPNKPIAPKDPRFFVMYDPKQNKYRCTGKNSSKSQDLTMTSQEILSRIETNDAWQRPFGDWFQANWQTKKEYAKPLFSSIAKAYEEKIETTLSNSKGIASILRFGPKPYYYLTPRKFYFVPSEADVTNLVSKGTVYGNPDGTGQKFLAKIGPADSDDFAQIIIYIRYANGMFASNPTVRVQELKNPENISWEELT